MHGIWVLQCFSILVKPHNFKCKISIGVYRIYLYTSDSPGVARTCVTPRTHNPSPKSVLETDDQHLPWKPAQSRQCPSELPATANTQWQLLGAGDGVTQGPGDKQSVIGSVIPAGTSWSLRPLCVSLGWGPNVASLLPSLTCGFPLTWLNSYMHQPCTTWPIPTTALFV